MPGVDPVTAIAEAIKEVAATLQLVFNGENRKTLATIKDVQGRLKALDIAEDIFRITDLVMKDKEVKYWKLRKAFDKKD